MQRNLDNVTAEKLIKIIQTSPIPLSTREVGTHLRQRHLRIPDYKISGILREMLRDGKVAFNKERWSIITNTGEFFPRLSVVAPSLSRETLSSIGWEMPRTPMVDTENGVKWTEQKIDQIKDQVPSGRWDTFRRLLAYYRQCVRNEEGSDASAFQNELGKRFVYLHKVGPWHPKPGQRWQSSIPLGPHLSPLLNSLPGPADDQALVVGYPVQAYYKVKQDEPDVAIIRPIFFFTVEYTVSREGLIVSCEDPRPEVNIGWLDYAFSRNPDRQRSFLSACGFINRWRPNDEAPGLERGEFSPSIDNLVSALTYFIPERIRQPMQLDCISDHPLHEPFKSGIYNRAVLMLAKRTKYTANLLKELAFIEKASEETLDRTALRYIFTHDEDLTTKESEKLLHESVVADTTQLNADQRRAIASLLTRNIAVITGPPGTGKSQVVSSSVANSRLRGQTVLFIVEIIRL